MNLENWPQGKVKRSNSTSGAGRTSFSWRLHQGSHQAMARRATEYPKEEPEILIKCFKLHVPRFLALDICNSRH